MLKKCLVFLAIALLSTASFATVEVNQATEAELDSIKGLGPSSTARILKAREQAVFRDWADFIARVKGIKPATAARLSKNGLTVQGAPYTPGERYALMLAIIAISLGASLGALARWQLGLWLNPMTTAGTVLPWGTLAANLIGGYLVGVAVAVFQALPQLDPAWRLALITGFLGGLTTFSSFSAEVVAMLMQQRYLLALGTAGVHVLGSLLLTVAGIHSASYFIASNT